MFITQTRKDYEDEFCGEDRLDTDRSHALIQELQDMLREEIGSFPFSREPHRQAADGVFPRFNPTCFEVVAALRGLADEICQLKGVETQAAKYRAELKEKASILRTVK